MSQREILFKAKRADNGNWIQGKFIANETTGQHMIMCVLPEHPDLYDFITVIPETVCQYTGLTDSDGEKVFDRDILKFFDKNAGYEWTGMVEFGNPNGAYTWGWQLVWMRGEKPTIDTLLWFDMEESGAYSRVIGNIHDN